MARVRLSRKPTKTQIFLCFPYEVPGGRFSLDRIPGSALCCIFCRCIICYAAALFMWFAIVFLCIFSPREPTFTVQNATLTQFNFNSTNNNNSSATLDYNLALDITIRNSNRRVGFYYRRIKVSAQYRNKEFDFVTLADPGPEIYQGHKNTTFLPQAVLQGQKQLVKFGPHDFSQFNKETASGIYSIKVLFSFRVDVRYGKLRTNMFADGARYRRLMVCKLKVPISSPNQTHVDGFKATRCSQFSLGIFA